MKKYIYGLAFLALLSACTISKDIETPKPALPANFRDVVITTDTASIADMQWKNFFTDPALQKLIDSAIVKNYDMRRSSCSNR
jgi:multidrug efflux system outer membrane protein